MAVGQGKVDCEISRIITIVVASWCTDDEIKWRLQTCSPTRMTPKSTIDVSYGRAASGEVCSHVLTSGHEAHHDEVRVGRLVMLNFIDFRHLLDMQYYPRLSEQTESAMSIFYIENV